MANLIKTIYFYDDRTYTEELADAVIPPLAAQTGPITYRSLPNDALLVLDNKKASLKIRCNLAVYLSVKENSDKRESLLRKIADASYEISRHLGISYNSVINTMRRELLQNGYGTSAEQYKQLLSKYLTGTDNAYKNILYDNVSKKGRSKAVEDNALLNSYLR